jgi:hypothetical protein
MVMNLRTDCEHVFFSLEIREKQEKVSLERDRQAAPKYITAIYITRRQPKDSLGNIIHQSIQCNSVCATIDLSTTHPNLKNRYNSVIRG